MGPSGYSNTWISFNVSKKHPGKAVGGQARLRCLESYIRVTFPSRPNSIGHFDLYQRRYNGPVHALPGCWDSIQHPQYSWWCLRCQSLLGGATWPSQRPLHLSLERLLHPDLVPPFRAGPLSPRARWNAHRHPRGLHHDHSRAGRKSR